MRRQSIRAFALALAFIAPASAHAHQIWIEQDAKGAKLYFGEFAENLREVSPGLLDKFVQLTGRLVSAKGESPVALSKAANAFSLASRAGKGESLIAEETSYPAFENKKDGKTTRAVWTPAARYIADFSAQAFQLALDVVPTGKPGEFQVVYANGVFTKGKTLSFANYGLKWAWTKPSGIIFFSPTKNPGRLLTTGGLVLGSSAAFSSFDLGEQGVQGRQCGEILGPACSLLGADDVLERRDNGLDAVERQSLRAIDDVFVAAQGDGLERHIEIAVVGDQVQHGDRAKKSLIACEGKSLGDALGTDPGIHGAQSAGQTLEVCRRAARADVEVTGERVGSVEDGAKSADDDVLDAFAREDRDGVSGAERLHGEARSSRQAAGPSRCARRAIMKKSSICLSSSSRSAGVRARLARTWSRSCGCGRSWKMSEGASTPMKQG